MPAGALVADVFHHRCVFLCQFLMTDFAFHKDTDLNQVIRFYYA